MQRDKIFETWNEIGHVMGGYSARHTYRMFKKVSEKNELFAKKLRHWRGPGKRIKMDSQEVEEFKKLSYSA